MALQRSRFTGVFKWVGLAIGAYLGAPRLGFTIGAVVDRFVWEERTKKRPVPSQKNVEFSPPTLVTSETLIPLGFGRFFSAGNILDYAIERNARYKAENGVVKKEFDKRTYFIAVGVSSNAAQIESGTIGNLSFIDNANLKSQFLPEGGEAHLPDRAQSEFYLHFYILDSYLPSNFDTGWTQIFSDTSFLWIIFTGQSEVNSLEKFLDNCEIFLFSKKEGSETSRKLTAADWNWNASERKAVFYQEVTKGWYRFTISFSDWIKDKYYRFEAKIADNQTASDPYGSISITDLEKSELIHWAFQCNWFALKFSTEEFQPENSTFSLIYNQGESNPIKILKEYLTNENWGLSISPEKIDETSFSTLEKRCEEENRVFNGLFTSQLSSLEVIQEFLKIAQAYLIYSQGKFKLIEDKFTKPVKKFSNNNILADSFQVTTKDISASVSRLKLQFEDAEHNFIVRSVLLDDLNLIEKVGIKETSQFLVGVNNEEQARKVGNYLFRNLRQKGTVTFKVSIKDLDVEPGDLIEVIKPELGYGDVLRVVEVGEEMNGDILISGVPYFIEKEIISIEGEEEFNEGTFEGTKLLRTEGGIITTE